MEIPSRTLRLSNGRCLGYAEFGPPDGSPVFYMHGFPGSRIEAILLTRYTSARIIALDRPGMGLSTFQPNRCFLDWPKDVLALADHLKIEKFRILGISGGSPYVLACCKEIPRSRLLAAGIIAGAYPLDFGTAGMLLPLRVLMYIAGSYFLSPLVKPLLNWEMGNLARNPDPEVFKTQFLKVMSTRPEKDRKCLEDDFVATGVIDSTREAFKQENDGVVWELKMYAQPWGFELEEVDFPGLMLWHGACDINIPVTMMQKASKKLIGSVRTIFAEETHMSTPMNHGEEILQRLLGSKPKERTFW